MKKSKFWLEDPSELLRSFTLIPSAQDTIEDKLNAITRVVIIVFIILIIAKQKHAATVLIVALIVVCLAYYYQRSMSKSEEKVEESCSHGCHEEEKFMAHAGNKKTEKKNFIQAKEKIHPRRPYPPSLPEDFVVRNQQNEEEFYTSRNDEDPRETYLQALRRKAETLRREEEIASLEAKLNISSLHGESGLAQNNLENNDDEKYYDLPDPEEQVPVVKRIYLDANEEDPNSSSTLFTPTIRDHGFRYGNRKRRPDPRTSTPVDPNDLMLSHQRSIYGKNPEIVARNRRAMQNNAL